MDRDSLLVIIPTYDEAENIAVLLHEIFRLDLTVEILVIDDASPDGTGRIVDDLCQKEKRLHVIHRPQRLGLGSAYLEGFRFALARDYTLVMEMDADFSHQPKYIPFFLDKMREHDLVIGSRYKDGVRVTDWPLSRLALSYFANLYARFFTGLRVYDTTSGFKCFRREALAALPLDSIRSDGYAFQIEVSVLCQRKGLRIGELPIIFLGRLYGASKMNRHIVHEALFTIWRLFLERIFHRR